MKRYKSQKLPLHKVVETLVRQPMRLLSTGMYSKVWWSEHPGRETKPVVVVTLTQDKAILARAREKVSPEARVHIPDLEKVAQVGRIQVWRMPLYHSCVPMTTSIRGDTPNAQRQRRTFHTCERGIDPRTGRVREDADQITCVRNASTQALGEALGAIWTEARAVYTKPYTDWHDCNFAVDDEQNLVLLDPVAGGNDTANDLPLRAGLGGARRPRKTLPASWRRKPAWRR